MYAAFTEIIVTKSLHELWNKEERQVDRVPFQDAMRVLQDDRIVLEATLEERVRNDCGDGCPQQ